MQDKNQILRVLIRDLNERGQGVGTVFTDNNEDPRKGKIAFVDGALPNEEVTAVIREEKSRYLVLDIQDVLRTSGDRIPNDCEYFPECGSCQLRHLSYKGELAFKEKRVRDLLSRTGPLNQDSPVFQPIIGMEDPFHYRGKSIFPLKETEDRDCPVAIGQYQRGSHDLVDLRSCKIQSEASLLIVNRVRELILEDGVSVYDEKNHKGTLRHLAIRYSFTNKEIMVIFVVNDQEADEIIEDWIPDLEEVLEDEGYKLHSVWLNDMETRGNRILSQRYRHLHGGVSLEEVVNGVKYKISPDSFFQVNPIQAARLFQEIVRAADLKPGDRVLDLYSGVGAISLQLAKAYEKLSPAIEITGVESVEQAVMDAELNMDINGLLNLAFIREDANSWLEDYENNPENTPFDLIVVDPPRKGLDQKGLDVILASHTPRLIYVSCNPATLARDLSDLAPAYTVDRVQPVDMFPRTAHVETVVLMSRVKE